jgi:hypothetical protein
MNEGVDFEGGTPVFVPSSHTWSDIYDVPCTYLASKGPSSEIHLLATY